MGSHCSNEPFSLPVAFFSWSTFKFKFIYFLFCFYLCVWISFLIFFLLQWTKQRRFVLTYGKTKTFYSTWMWHSTFSPFLYVTWSCLFKSTIFASSHPHTLPTLLPFLLKYLVSIMLDPWKVSYFESIWISGNP